MKECKYYLQAKRLGVDVKMVYNMYENHEPIDNLKDLKCDDFYCKRHVIY